MFMMFTVFTCSEHEHFAGLKYLKDKKSHRICDGLYFIFLSFGVGRGEVFTCWQLPVWQQLRQRCLNILLVF